MTYTRDVYEDNLLYATLYMVQILPGFSVNGNGSYLSIDITLNSSVMMMIAARVSMVAVSVHLS